MKEGTRNENALTGALLAAVIAAAAWVLWPQGQQPAPVPLTAAPIAVSVRGAVRQPGSYTLPWGSRAGAAIDAAGGMTPAAEASLVNPAAILEDGEQLVVPARAVTEGAAQLGERVNLNEATVSELEDLPGIGPALAARIISGRPYRSLADLDAVKGIGPAALARLAPLVRF